MKRNEALKLREIIEQAVTSIDDKAASEGASLFPRLQADGSLVKTGTRINWNGAVKKASVDLWDTEENNPENAPDLWADIEYRAGIRIIPNQITVSTAFSMDELGWWGDALYKSKANANVYTPEQYAGNWTLVSD